MTEEDEAFDELSRKQGMWGGGFQAKRAMAADKLQDESDMLTIAYLDGYERGKKAALAQPAQEPVAWMVYTQDGQSVYVTDNPTDIQKGQRALPLYTTPPKREWVGLTDEEREGIAQDYSLTGLGYQSPFKAIEAMLKEKNT